MPGGVGFDGGAAGVGDPGGGAEGVVGPVGVVGSVGVGAAEPVPGEVGVGVPAPGEVALTGPVADPLGSAEDKVDGEAGVDGVDGEVEASAPELESVGSDEAGLVAAVPVVANVPVLVVGAALGDPLLHPAASGPPARQATSTAARTR